nr:hypothetical protein [Tanacetum cinerariifolium]
DVTMCGQNKSHILSRGREIDLFNLIRAPNPTKVNTESRPRAPHKVPVLTDHTDLRPSGSSHRGKSHAAIQLDLASNVFVPEGTPADINDPDPLSFADAPSRHPVDVLRLRFEQEAKLLRKSFAQVARRDKRIQARELEIKNLEELPEAEADMKKATEGKSFGLIQELEDMRARFSDLQAFADVVSARVAKGMSEGLKHGVEHGQAQIKVESSEAYDPEAEAKFVAALQSLKDLKYHLMDQLEGLKDAPMDVIMAALYLKSDTREDAPQSIRDLLPSSSQLTILVYLECVLCSMRVFAISRRLGYSNEDTEFVAARVATCLCGKP